MGHAASNEMLIARWTELINDPALQDLPRGPLALEYQKGNRRESPRLPGCRCAREAWLVGERGDTRYFRPEGERASSEFGVHVELPKRSKDPAG
jgi:hypothetical protein